eukprot:TRINITY_DN215_c0_g1_i1.p1 TRINITY_DN215_c0_g1~~TRINITY_DN215_c0_g1_i1.p1  ORF type:complete len:202 (+),score=67.91 TRINITY_DN215_c0_g1_i1:661-1266(+)
MADKPKKGDKPKKEKAPKAEKAEKKEEKKEEKPKEEKPKETKKVEKKEEPKQSMVEEGDEEKKNIHAPFRKFFYRGYEVHKLLDLSHRELMKLMHARVRRRFQRGHVPNNLMRRLRKAKRDAARSGDKPKVIKTHLRNMVIIPEMVGSVIGVHNGKEFTQVEIKPDMIGHYLGEFAISYKPVKHGRPGVGATNSSRIIPLK